MLGVFYNMVGNLSDFLFVQRFGYADYIAAFILFDIVVQIRYVIKYQNIRRSASDKIMESLRCFIIGGTSFGLLFSGVRKIRPGL